MLTGQPGEPSNVTFGLSPLSPFQYTSILIFRHRAGNEPIALMRFGPWSLIAKKLPFFFFRAFFIIILYLTKYVFYRIIDIIVFV